MPDVWTTNPEKLRTALDELCGNCRVSPRVLPDRDPDWTCHLDLPAGTIVNGAIGWDVYIHDVRELALHPRFLSLEVALVGGGILLGLAWGWLRRRAMGLSPPAC